MAALTDESGVVVESYSYDAFGEPTIYNGSNNVITESAVGNPYMFTGRRYDEETGLYYYRARYYSPDIGRFLQTDPIGYYDGLNLYTYAGNNPLNWLDPWGLCKELSREEFYSRMSDMRDIAEERAWWERWNPFSYAFHDSYFFQGANNDRLFNFEGRKMLGSEINYYAIGMLYRRYWEFLGGYGKFQSKLDVYRWKIYNIPGSRLWYWFGWNDEDDLYHLPTENELYMFKRGWEEYPKEDLFK